MAHEVESLVFAGATPWHGLGERIEGDRLYDVEYLKAHPSLNWSVALQPLFLSDGRRASTQAVVRSTDGRILGEVGEDYTPVQNADVIDWFAPFLQSRAVSAECLGSLREGSRVYMLGRFQGTAEVVKGDPIESFLLLANSHDGSMRVNVGFTPIRVVCANTLRAARGDSRSKLLQLRHTKNVGDSLKLVQETINTASRTFETTVETYRKLAASPCTDETLRKYVKVVFQQKIRVAETQARIAEEVTVQRLRVGDLDTSRIAALINEQAEEEAEEESCSRILPRVQHLFEAGHGASIPGVRGTLWGALNAVSEYVQHERGRKEENRTDEALFGSIVQRATDQAVAFTRIAA